MIKHLLIILIGSFVFFSLAFKDKRTDSINNRKIETLSEELKNNKKELFERTITSYQQTNDRLNNYLTFTGVIATIFGVVIALGGIWVGFESLKSSKKRDEAIKILEEAKKYVEEKKSTFDLVIQEKLKEIDNDYKKLIDINMERLLSDVNHETQNLKELAEKKTLEIKEFSIQDKKDTTMETLQKRIAFFENISIPDDPKILFSKAKLLKQKEMYNEAIELLLKVIEKDTLNNDAFWELAWNYNKIDNKAKALENYKKALAIKDTAPTRNNIGVIYLEDSPYDALNEFERAIELMPSDKIYYRNKATTLVKLNSIELAIAFYKSIIELDKTDLTSYLDLIRVLRKQKRNQEAIEYYDLAILNLPNDAMEVNYSKALFLDKVDRKEDAFNLLQNLVNLNYKTELCLQVMAKIKIDLGETEDALKIIAAVKELNIKNPLAYTLEAQVLMEKNPKSAMAVIANGLEHISDYNYLLNSARLFMKSKLILQAKELYSKAVVLLNGVLPEHKEVDILCCYEAYILLDSYSAAKIVIEANNRYINTTKYKIIKEFADLCLSFLEHEEVNLNSRVEKIKLLKSQTKESSGWIFEELKCYLSFKLDAKKFEILDNVIKFMQDELSYDELLEKIF